MPKGVNLANTGGYESDASYEPDAPKTVSQSAADPVPPASDSAAFTTASQIESTTRELGELSKRTAAIESLLLNLTASLQLRGPPAPTSTPITQTSGRATSFGTTTATEQTTHRRGYLPPFPSLSNTVYSNSFSDSTVREALELVPKYDGHNMPVLQFIRACKRAKELLPLSSEAHLVRLLRNKLTGHAYLAVEDKIHDTIDKLTDSLKRAFGPALNPNYYRGQLSVNFMKEGEHIFDYIGRVKDLRSAIIEADQTLYCRPLSNTELMYVDMFALESFFDGLPHALRTELRNEGYQNLEEAYDKAVSATKRLERDSSRRPSARCQAPASRTTAAAEPFNTVAHAPPPVTILQRDSAPLPRATVFQPSQLPSVFPTKICGYCKRRGHLISECRKRQYNNANRDSLTQQGNLRPASTDQWSRGRSNTRDVLPLTENLPSTSSDPQPETSQQSN